MQVPLDLVNLFLYSFQQLGVMLGVGAETILLITYAISVRDGVVDAKETQIARAVGKALLTGLWLMVLSGAAIVALHISLGQAAILLAPAFLFKWLLIAFLLAATFVWRGKPFPTFVWEGLIGASWYALFLVHIIAPVAAWSDLIVLYVVWVAGFLLIWSAAVYMTHKKPVSAPVPAVKTEPKLLATPPEPRPVIKPDPVRPSIPVPAAKEVFQPKVEPKLLPPTHPVPILKIEVPKPISPPSPPLAVEPVKPTPPPPPPVTKPELPTMIIPHVPTPTIEEHFGLPAIRVMPRTLEEAKKHI